MTNPVQKKWLDSLIWQVQFHQRSGATRRQDPEFEWEVFEHNPIRRFPQLRAGVRWLKSVLGMRVSPQITVDWLLENASLLWNSRQMLADDLSRLLFDAALTVRTVGHRKYYFPRIDFDDLLAILGEQDFTEDGFPHDYLGVPLGIYDVCLTGRQEAPVIRVITRAIQLQLVNSYRQYLVKRSGYDISPRPGEVVYDCGACIGEISLLFAGLVAPRGEVHLFDPMPLHTRFCELQASLNPALAETLHINELAISNITHNAKTASAVGNRIVPGAISTDDFACTTIDDYAKMQERSVDFIKMDIEGAEMAALHGAEHVISTLHPRLAISGYHKPEDLWEIPNKIKDLNPGYRLAFGHHTPIMWESVFYAFDS